MVDYDTLIAYEVPKGGEPVKWVKASSFSEFLPEELMLRVKKYRDFHLLIDVCSDEELKNGEGELLVSRIEMLEDIANFVNEIVKEIIVKPSVVHIVRDIKTLLKIQEKTCMDLRTMKNETAIIRGDYEGIEGKPGTTP